MILINQLDMLGTILFQKFGNIIKEPFELFLSSVWHPSQ